MDALAAFVSAYAGRGRGSPLRFFEVLAFDIALETASPVAYQHHVNV